MDTRDKKNEKRYCLLGGLLALSLTAGCAAQDEAADTRSVTAEGMDAKSAAAEGADAKSVRVGGADVKSAASGGATPRRAAPGHKPAHEVRALLRRWHSRTHAVSERGAESPAPFGEPGDSQ